MYLCVCFVYLCVFWVRHVCVPVVHRPHGTCAITDSSCALLHLPPNYIYTYLMYISFLYFRRLSLYIYVHIIYPAFERLLSDVPGCPGLWLSGLHCPRPIIVQGFSMLCASLL
ncbi:unnamed protein product, partial [Sphacelaria rigidula]